MRSLVVATLICSSAILGRAALADPAQQTSAGPSMAAPAPAPGPTAPQAAAPEQSGVNLDEIVCRNSPPATGTRLGGGRECHTVREWNDRERQAQDLTRRQQITGFAQQPK
ncbi:MAG TPA: hypothetical protein VHT03_02595 [Rhizomicrobium sp.]|nr:hypothetical protein [Rhizomicrobium sp.]